MKAKPKLEQSMQEEQMCWFSLKWNEGGFP